MLEYSEIHIQYHRLYLRYSIVVILVHCKIVRSGLEDYYFWF